MADGPDEGPMPDATKGLHEFSAQHVKRFIDSLKFTQPISVLDEASVKERHPCPKCARNRQYYCYDCIIPTVAKAKPHDVPLPIKMHVILSPKEHRGKATSIQAGVISSDVSIHVFPDVPFPEDGVSLLAYPSPQARTLTQLKEDGVLGDVKRIYFIDSTWQQSKAIARDPKVQQLIPVRLNEYRTMFWRYQNTDESFLATVEAMYYFVRDFAVAKGIDYKGEYDDMLYYYVHQFTMIQRNYIEKNRGFTKRHARSDVYILDKETLFNSKEGEGEDGNADEPAHPAKKKREEDA